MTVTTASNGPKRVYRSFRDYQSRRFSTLSLRLSRNPNTPLILRFSYAEEEFRSREDWYYWRHGAPPTGHSHLGTRYEATMLNTLAFLTYFLIRDGAKLVQIVQSDRLVFEVSEDES